MSYDRDPIGNPFARYRSEKGPPVKKDSTWLDVESGDKISNTCWPSGYVDYSGREPEVWIDDPQISEREWKESRPAGGKRLVTYLLHPDKWARHSGSFKAARDFIPNVSAAPSQPIGYALKIVYQTPVKLSSRPELPQNPRAWFESFGEATGCKQVGEVKIHATGKIKPVYAKIVIHEPGRGPRGAGCVPILRVAARANPSYHYLNVVTPGPLIVLRVPTPTPRWKSLTSAIYTLLRAHGLRRRDLFSIDAFAQIPEDPAERTSDDLESVAKLEQAFAGAAVLPKFWLYDWRDGKFELVREPY